MKHLIILLALLPLHALAADADFILTIKNHRFLPSEMRVPAGKKIKLQVINQDATPEEFESHALNREKVIAGHGSTAIFIGPLEAGRYQFMGEFHEATAQGVIIAQ